MGLNAGFEPIAWNWIEVSPDLMASSYFTTQELADEQPELVEKFQNAMAESAHYAEENPDETRNIITSYTEIPEEITETMRLPRWVDSADQESLIVSSKFQLKTVCLRKTFSSKSSCQN